MSRSNRYVIWCDGATCNNYVSGSSPDVATDMAKTKGWHLGEAGDICSDHVQPSQSAKESTDG